MTRQKLTGEQRKAANLARQMRYRERHLQRGEDGTAPLARINCLVDATAKEGLERLSACFSVTQKRLIERIVEDAEVAICDPLDAGVLADYRAGGYRAPMPECLFRSNADEIESLRSRVDELTRALGIAQTHVEARQAVIDELARQLETLRAAAAVETVSAKGEDQGEHNLHDQGEQLGAVQGQADDKAKKGGPWPAEVRAMAVRMKAEGAKLPAIAEAMSAAAGGRAPPDTSSLTPQLKRWAAKLGV